MHIHSAINMCHLRCALRAQAGAWIGTMHNRGWTNRYFSTVTGSKTTRKTVIGFKNSFFHLFSRPFRAFYKKIVLPYTMRRVFLPTPWVSYLIVRHLEKEYFTYIRPLDRHWTLQAVWLAQIHICMGYEGIITLHFVLVICSTTWNKAWKYFVKKWHHKPPQNELTTARNQQRHWSSRLAYCFILIWHPICSVDVFRAILEF